MAIKDQTLSRPSGTVYEKRVSPIGLGAFVGLPDPENGKPEGAIVFAHGSGSSRFSPRNTSVAEALRRSGFATVLFDLLTEEESSDRRNVFDVELLADRLVKASDWVRARPELETLPIGYFGASTGAAAAIKAAALRPDLARAVVSRGGRPDLAMAALGSVRAPTLLIVGSLDAQVLQLNRQALAALTCEKKLSIIPGASHLFEEPGTLDMAIELSSQWFRFHLSGRGDALNRRTATGGNPSGRSGARGGQP